MSEDGHRTDGADGRTPPTGGVDAPSVDGGTLAGAPPEPQSPGLAKILPFPRDWFGPIEDLVPILPGPSTTGPAISAASFWDEDAGAVHQVVESLDRRWIGDDAAAEPLVPALEPPVEPALPTLDQDRQSAAESHYGYAGEPRDDGAAEVGDGDARSGEVDDGDAPERDAPERVRRLRPVAIFCAGCALLLVCAAVALGLLGTAARQPHLSLAAKHGGAGGGVRAGGGSHSAPAVTPEQTVTVLVATGTAGKRHRHRVRRAAVQPVTGSTSSDTSRTAGSAEPATSEHSSAVAPTRSSDASIPASAPAASAGGGCVQSPDSGCLP